MPEVAPPIHLIGISGIGMSALARILLQRGHRVTGSSDRRTALTDALEREGASIAIGHAASNLGHAGQVVISSAISTENPELTEALRRGLPVLKRGVFLAQILNEQCGIAVAGTHGKSSTTAMIVTVLEAGGLAPTYAIGAERIDNRTNASSGSGIWFVAESDESDRSFVAMRPRIAVLNNIENDHVANNDELTELVTAFGAFLAALPPEGLAVVGADDERSASVASQSRAGRTLTFGIRGGDLVAHDVQARGFGVRFRPMLRGVPLGTVALQVPGAINILNALPSIAIGLELGIPFATIASALAEFPGIRRRFEVLARSERMIVIDDYAHHPTAVAATIAAARAAFGGPIVAVFQPHRYTRTSYLAGEFARALRAADRVVLTEIYPASELPIPGVDSRLIGEPLRACGADVQYTALAALPEYLMECVPHGSLVLLLGAGSITAAAARLAQLLQAQGEAAVL